MSRALLVRVIRVLLLPLVFLRSVLPARVKHVLNVASSALVSCARLYSGGWAVPGVTRELLASQPELTLYEFEACPFCRRVRETASALSLTLHVRPTPRVTLAKYSVMGHSRYRPEVQELGGKLQFPFLLKNATDEGIYESDAIMRELMVCAGVPEDKVAARLPIMLRKGKARFMALMASALMRPLASHGMLRCPSKLPETPLVLYSHEADPCGRVVRDALTCLELPYTLHNLPINSPRRAQLQSTFPNGKIQLPYLIDPNENFASTKSFEIVQHLYATYQTGPFPDESVLDYSTAGASASHGTFLPKQD